MVELLGLDWQAWATLATIVAMLAALLKSSGHPDLILLGALGMLLLLGILTPKEAFAGLSNPAPLAVGALFVVAAGVRNTGALSWVDPLLFQPSRYLPATLGRLMLASASLSAFLNNTPIVAMLIPRVEAWSEKSGIPVSKLMMPLSFGAILGGTTTLIGTSTNLLVSGLMEASGYSGLGLFELTPVAVPAALAAMAYFVLVGYRLLPERRQGGATVSSELQNCLFELRVAPNSPLAGKTVQQAGLRSLGEAYLPYLHRDGHLLWAAPETVLREGDILDFVGNPSAIDKLLERPGLERTVDGVGSPELTAHPLYEAIVAPSSPLVGRTLREVGFRERYDGVVLGIHRRDEQIRAPLGRAPIQAGDLLFVEAPPGFDRRWSGRRDEFYLVAPYRGEQPKPQPQKAPIAIAILVATVAFAATGIAPIAMTAFLGALATIATGCLSRQDARRAVDLSVLIVLAASLGLGRAVEKTGLADAIANGIIERAPQLGTLGVLVAIYAITSLLTEVVTNNGAAAIVLPIGLAASAELGAPPEAFAIAVAIAASTSFLTPIGYQTNLMVMSPGGYRFGDYARSGIAVDGVVMVTSIAAIAQLWL
jgi:di/tricarboxylate transporter